MSESNLYDLILSQYDHTDENSILDRAQLIKGKTLDYISKKSPFENFKLDKTNKGEVGNFVEKEWFGLKNNSRPEPDFIEAGIELKVSPVKDNKLKSIKENMKVCSINYSKLIDETWDESHVKQKVRKVLMIYYLWGKNKEEWGSQEILDFDLWILKPNEKKIRLEWLHTQNKVAMGLAHKLTASESKILCANTSGTSKRVEQPVQKIEKFASRRSFYFKRKFICDHWQKVRMRESIQESLGLNTITNYEQSLLDLIHNHKGKTLGEIANKYQFSISKNKDAAATIIKLMLGFKTVKSKIKELDERGTIVKTIPINSNNHSLFEAISFRKIIFKDFIHEEWDESLLVEQLTRILFVAVSRNKRKGVPIEDRVLTKAFFWSPNSNDLKIIKQEWLTYQKQFNSGLVIKKIPVNSKKGFKEVITNIAKESDTKIIHLRPHAQDSNDRDEDSFGTSAVKQSFWLNKKFVEKLLKESLNE